MHITTFKIIFMISVLNFDRKSIFLTLVWQKMRIDYSVLHSNSVADYGFQCECLPKIETRNWIIQELTKTQWTKWEGTDYMARGSISERVIWIFPSFYYFVRCRVVNLSTAFIHALLNYSRAEFSLYSSMHYDVGPCKSADFLTLAFWNMQKRSLRYNCNKLISVGVVMCRTV
jgi:hypothetical protein